MENYFSKKFTIDNKCNPLTQKNKHQFLAKNRVKKELNLTYDINRCCCFTGHRDLPKNLIPQIRRDLDGHLEKLYTFYGVKAFISGGAIGFDMLAAEAVVELKHRYPDVKLIFALPCVEHTKKWSDSAVAKFRILSLYADEIIYVSQGYYTGCMHVRNKYMLENSEYCIAYCKKTGGGSYYTLNTAKKMNRTVIEL